MKKPLLIIGAGNVGGFLSYNINEFEHKYDVLGFLDDDPDKIGQVIYGLKVLGPVSDAVKFKNQNISLVVGIAQPAVKSHIVDFLSKYDFDFPPFISKSVWLSKEVTIGKGVILYPGVSINYESFLGDFVIINMNCAIGHNCTISSYSTLAPGVNLAGFTFVEECVDIGIGVSTKQNLRIGNSSLIGGQSMLIKDIPPGSRIVGIPGRRIDK